MSFSENLKAARKAKNMSQQDFADLMHTDRSTISKYETTGSYSLAANIFKLCEILEISFDDLFKE